MIKIILLIFALLYFFFEHKIFLNEINNIGKSIKISVFLPIFNKGKYLKRSIGSIQRQTLKNIEIIAVNDYSADNSLEILNEFSKKDPRVKIINNDKNYGLLYSRAMGIKNSKGEYLMCLDPDDELQGPNNLKFLYNKAKYFDIDVLAFNILYLPDKIRLLNYPKINKIIKQPELFKIAFKEDYSLLDYFITNKLVKKEIFNLVYNKLIDRINGEKWNYHEDNIWSLLIYKYANSILYIKNEIYYYYKNNDSEMCNRGKIIEIKNLLYKYEMYLEMFKNKEKYILAIIKQILEVIEFLKIYNIINENNTIKNTIITIFKENVHKFNNNKIKERINNLINKIS